MWRMDARRPAATSWKGASEADDHGSGETLNGVAGVAAHRERRMPPVQRARARGPPAEAAEETDGASLRYKSGPYEQVMVVEAARPHLELAAPAAGVGIWYSVRAVQAMCSR